MSRKSRARKRTRKKLKRRIQLQLPQRRNVSTAQLFELIAAQSNIIATILDESSS